MSSSLLRTFTVFANGQEGAYGVQHLQTGTVVLFANDTVMMFKSMKYTGNYVSGEGITMRWDDPESHPAGKGLFGDSNFTTV